jgi:hypothetical protein
MFWAKLNEPPLDGGSFLSPASTFNRNHIPTIFYKNNHKAKNAARSIVPTLADHNDD